MAAFDTVRWFIHSFPETLFTYPNTTYCGELCYQLLRNTNINNGEIRSRAGALLWLLIEVNHKRMCNVVVVACYPCVSL
jgi:hypothetical protein